MIAFRADIGGDGEGQGEGEGQEEGNGKGEGEDACEARVRASACRQALGSGRLAAQQEWVRGGARLRVQGGVPHRWSATE